MKKFFVSIFSIIIWLLFSVSFILWTVVIALVGVFSSGKFLHLMGRLLCRTNLMLAGISVKKKGFENIEKGKQYVIMMNHINLFDPFLFNGHFPGRAIAFQEESHFNWPFYGWVMKKMGHIPITRKNPRKALRDLQKGPEVLKTHKDFSLIIFPEGTRSRTGKLGTFKKGAFYLALDAGVDILPMIQIGGYDIKKRTEWQTRPGKIEFIAEKPISIDGYTRKNVDELIEKTRQVFLNHVE